MKIIVVQKNCDIKEIDWKKNIDLENLYKKCGFRKNKDFAKRHTWKINENKYVSIYAKNSGRANTENKYELPPPVDKDLYFGNIAIIAHEGNNVNTMNDMSESSWKLVYEKLMGGFEDIGEEDSYSEDEYVAPENLTKEGYEKDGFVTDGSEEEEDTGGDDSEEEEEATYFSSSNENENENENDNDEDDSLEYSDEEEIGSDVDDDDNDNDDDDDVEEEEKKEDDEALSATSANNVSDSDELCEENYQY